MTIDYKKLLVRYVEHVADQEGIDFLMFVDQINGLTREETAALLEAVAEECRDEDYKADLLRWAKEAREGKSNEQD